MLEGLSHLYMGSVHSLLLFTGGASVVFLELLNIYVYLHLTTRSCTPEEPPEDNFSGTR